MSGIGIPSKAQTLNAVYNPMGAMIYRVYLQRTRTKKVCVCLVSGNGKLVLKGEPLNRTIDAVKVGQSIIAAMSGDAYVIEVLPWHHRWPKNSGPKKKAK